MLAWLLVPSFLVLASFISGALAPAGKVSLQRAGEACLDYTQIFYEHDRLVQGALEQDDAAEALEALKGSPEYMLVRSILEAEFGYCIGAAGEVFLPQLYSKEASLDVLNDKQRISVLPYVLDHMSGDYQWIYLIRGLVELGRFDLLQQLEFPNMTSQCFYRLMSVTLPALVVRTAAEALQRKEPTSVLAKLLALAGFRTQRIERSEASCLPLFVLRLLHANGVSIKEKYSFTGGLEEPSISFWMYLAKQDKQQREKLLKRVLKRGDDQSRYLASAFFGPVSKSRESTNETDVYQAMLIHFRFSDICNEHIIQNYERMIGTPFKVGYHTACALLERGQSRLLESAGDRLQSGVNWNALIGQIYRMKDDKLNPLVCNLLARASHLPSLLHSLIKRKTDDAFTRLVWDAIQARRLRTIDNYSCSASLADLKRLLFEQDIPVGHVQKMFSIPEGFPENVYEHGVSEAAHVLYSVMFWEASEWVVNHFLDLVPEDQELDYDRVWKLTRWGKYSNKLCGKLIKYLGPLDSYWRENLSELRPGLLEEVNANAKRCQSSKD